MALSTGPNVLHKNRVLQPTLVRSYEIVSTFLLQTSCCQVKMDYLGTDSTAPLDPRSTPQPPVGPIHRLPQLPPLFPAPLQEPADHFNDWQTIGEQRDFYDERDCLNPSNNLTSEKLRTRGGDDVVIFDYSLDPDYRTGESGNHAVWGSSPSSQHFGADDDIFFRVPKNELLESKQFNKIISPTKESRLMQSRGPRLGIM